MLGILHFRRPVWPGRRARTEDGCAGAGTAVTKRRRRVVRWLLRQVVHCLALIGLGSLVHFACFDLSRVTSDSMSPTLQGTSWRNGDLVLAERVSYWFRTPRRWEIVAFHNSEGVQVMKRVIGLPGEHVQMLRDGSLFIDGEPLERPEELRFIRYFPYGNLVCNQTAACGDGYYVLGDESRDSDDSRFNGPLRPGDIVGRAWLILTPAERRGFVHGQRFPQDDRALGRMVQE